MISDDSKKNSIEVGGQNLDKFSFKSSLGENKSIGFKKSFQEFPQNQP